jgi:manganese/zinc/iron transport system permease protein
MLALAVGLGVVSAVGGYGLARVWDASIAGAMATVAGLLFLAALLFSPGHGLLARLLILQRMGSRLSGQLVLLHLQKGGDVPEALLEQRFGWSPVKLRRVLGRLRREGLVESQGDGLHLTARGAQVLESTGRIELAHRLPSPG